MLNISTLVALFITFECLPFGGNLKTEDNKYKGSLDISELKLNNPSLPLTANTCYKQAK